MKWIYILKCDDEYYYVGQTERLYRRFWEHLNGNGGLNTSQYCKFEIVGIYKVNTICKFLEYNEIVLSNNDKIYESNGHRLLNSWNNIVDYWNDDSHYAENNITECLMLHKKDKINIKGGKYTSMNDDKHFNMTLNITNPLVNNLPLCKCGIPCDIKKNDKKNNIYFRCAKKNMWDKFKDLFEITEDPCNFYMEYTFDKKIISVKKERLSALFKKSIWLNNVELNDGEDFCVGGCKKTSEDKTFINDINLCFDCFINNNNELSKKYTSQGKCLINLNEI